jgi:hypothetical protein
MAGRAVKCIISDMKSFSFLGRSARLLVLLAVAVAYIVWILIQHRLTHITRLDGGIGVFGGLYICSHPAASFVDLLFLGRHTAVTGLNLGQWVAWILINLTVFILGVMMITIGATRFV